MKRFFLTLILISIMLTSVWGAGLLWFVTTIPNTVKDHVSKVDAIVILTGGSDRLRVGVELLSLQKGEKLFISGVGEGVDKLSMLIMSGPLPDGVDTLLPNIHLGYNAKNTHGNAIEVATWLEPFKYDSIRLVTANYHVPRSLYLLKQQVPELEIIAHPVFPKQVTLKEWWNDDVTRTLLISEYSKYSISVAQHFLNLS